MKNYTLTTAPTVEPATLAEFFNYARISAGPEDAMAAIMLSAGREYVEAMTGRALLMQTWKLTAQGWDERGATFVWRYGSYWGVAGVRAAGVFYETPGQIYGTAASAVTLDRTPVSSVTSVKYYPADGGAQTTLVEGTDYAVDLTSTPARILPIDGKSWPDLADRADAVQIIFVAGYGSTSSAVPAMLKLATLSLSGYFYDQRSPVNIGNIVNPLPHSLDAILAQFRVRGQVV